MLKKYALSVIIPTYNSENNITKCLESVVEQSFAEYEIIIKDGGSSDGTLKMVNDIKTLHPLVRIVVFSERDDGIYDAMNRAVSMCSGTWLYFLGSDDYLYDRHVFTDIFSHIARKDLDMIYGNVKKIHSGQIHFGKYDLQKLFHYNICHQAIFLKRSAFDIYGPFDTKYAACADWDLNLRLFKNRMQIKFVDRIIAYYNEKGFSTAFRDELFFRTLEKEKKIYFDYWPNRVLSVYKRLLGRLKNLAR